MANAKEILVLDNRPEQCREFCELLCQEKYQATPMYSLESLEACLDEKQVRAVFLDIDTVPVDNRTVRQLTLKFPGVYFFCLSEQPFHPELKDAICYHIYACLRKPVDPDELFYLLKSTGEDMTTDE